MSGHECVLVVSLIRHTSKLMITFHPMYRSLHGNSLCSFSFFWKYSCFSLHFCWSLLKLQSDFFWRWFTYFVKMKWRILPWCFLSFALWLQDQRWCLHARCYNYTVSTQSYQKCNVLIVICTGWIYQNFTENPTHNFSFKFCIAFIAWLTNMLCFFIYSSKKANDLYVPWTIFSHQFIPLFYCQL